MGSKLAWVSVVCVLAGILGGCSQARLVRRDANSAVISIPSNTDLWPTHHRESAETLMQRTFPEGYVIEREEEVVVGQKQQTHTNTTQNGNALIATQHVHPGRKGEAVHTTAFVTPSSQQTQQMTTVSDVTEWHIHIRRNPHGGTAPAGAIPGMR